MSHDPAAVFAATFAALYAAHEVGDHWVQTHRQATTKGTPGGELACLAHVLTLSITKLVFLLATSFALDLPLPRLWLAVGVGIDAASHYWADRRTPLLWMAGLVERLGVNGKTEFFRLGAPRSGRDDNPTLGTGAYALDQSWHVGWLFVAALIIAAGTTS